MLLRLAKCFTKRVANVVNKLQQRVAAVCHVLYAAYNVPG